MWYMKKIVTYSKINGPLTCRNTLSSYSEAPK